MKKLLLMLSFVLLLSSCSFAQVGVNVRLGLYGVERVQVDCPGDQNNDGGLCMENTFVQVGEVDAKFTIDQIEITKSSYGTYPPELTSETKRSNQELYASILENMLDDVSSLGATPNSFVPCEQILKISLSHNAEDLTCTFCMDSSEDIESVTIYYSNNGDISITGYFSDELTDYYEQFDDLLENGRQ